MKSVRSSFLVSRTLRSLLVLVLLAAFAGSVRASSNISFVGGTEGFGSFSESHHDIFYAQSRYWAFYFIPYQAQNIFYSVSPVGAAWPTDCHFSIEFSRNGVIDCNGGGGGLPQLGCYNCPDYTPGYIDIVQWAMTSDASHVYFAFVGFDTGIWFASASLNVDGSLTFNTTGGRVPNTSATSGCFGLGGCYDANGGYWLKPVSSVGRGDFNPFGMLSIGVNSQGHVFIAYSGSTCALCVFDSSASPYASWTNSLNVPGAINQPITVPYRGNEMMVVRGDYSSVWNGGWQQPAALSGNEAVSDAFAYSVDSSVFLFERTASCRNGSTSDCVGFFTFNGNRWSDERATNIPLYSNYIASLTPFALTYDTLNNEFLGFARDPSNTVLYEYSANPHSTMFQSTTIASGRLEIDFLISPATTSINATSHIDNASVLWLEPNPYGPGPPDLILDPMYIFIGPAPQPGQDGEQLGQ